jgi:AraC-like DNA-binding protein
MRRRPTSDRLPDLSLAGSYLRAIADCVAGAGADAGALLARHGLPASAADDVTLELSLADFADLLRDAIATTGEPALGLLVGDRIGVDAHGALGAAALRGATLREVAHLLVARLDARAPLVGLDAVEVGAEFRLVVREALPRGEVRRALLEAVVVALAKLVETIAQGTAPILRVAFDDREPAYAGFARDLLKRPVRWRAGFTGIVLPTTQIDARLRGGDPVAFAVFARRAEEELAAMDRDRPVSAALRRLLISRRGGMPSLSAAARLLHMHPRTLHRRLVAEGTSYRNLVDEVRATLAREYATEPGWTVPEIALALGYGDPANFRRARRRWRAGPRPEGIVAPKGT